MKEEPSSSGGWWAYLSSPTNVFECSACLSQVEWADADAANDNNTDVHQDDHSSVKAIEQHHPSASDDCVRDVNLNNSLLIDEDSNQSSDQTIDDVHNNITLDITTEAFEDQLRSSSPPIHNHTNVVTPPRDHVHHSSTIGEFGSYASETSSGDGDDMVADDCPICLHSMSNADVLYPLPCSGTNCSYNFCLQCMLSLVKSSKDTYQIASDGSLRVKVHLNCPNCRASIKGIIQHTICRRQEMLTEQVEEENTEDIDQN